MSQGKEHCCCIYIGRSSLHVYSVLAQKPLPYQSSSKFAAAMMQPRLPLGMLVRIPRYERSWHAACRSQAKRCDTVSEKPDVVQQAAGCCRSVCTTTTSLHASRQFLQGGSGLVMTVLGRSRFVLASLLLLQHDVDCPKARRHDVCWPKVPVKTRRGDLHVAQKRIDEQMTATCIHTPYL